jgi:hypothetical protein
MSNVAIGFIGLFIGLGLVALRIQIGVALGIVSFFGIAAVVNWRAAWGVVSSVPFNFVGNEYLEQNGAVCMEQDKDLPANARHHYGEDVIILVRYLVDRIKNV